MEELLLELRKGLASGIDDIKACEIFSNIKSGYDTKPSLANARFFIEAVKIVKQFPKRRMLYRQVYRNRLVYARLIAITSYFE